MNWEQVGNIKFQEVLDFKTHSRYLVIHHDYKVGKIQRFYVQETLQYLRNELRHFKKLAKWRAERNGFVDSRDGESMESMRWNIKCAERGYFLTKVA